MPPFEVALYDAFLVTEVAAEGAAQVTAVGAVQATGVQEGSATGNASVTAVANVQATGVQDGALLPFSVVLWETSVVTEGFAAGTTDVPAIATVATTGVQEGAAEGDADVSAVAGVATTGTQESIATGDASVTAVASVAAVGVQEGQVPGDAEISAVASVDITSTSTKAGSAAVSAVADVSAVGGSTTDVQLPAPVVIGTTIVTGSTATITITSVVPAGVVVFVDVVHRNPNDIPEISDSSGNEYVTDLSETRDGNTRALRFRAVDVKRLIPGNTIELAGFAATPDGDGAVIAYYIPAVLGDLDDTARDDFPSGLMASSGPLGVTTVPSLLLGMLETNNNPSAPSAPDMPGFDQIALGPNSGPDNRSVLAAYRAVGVPDNYEWDVTFGSNKTGSINLLSYPILGSLAGTITIRAVSGPRGGRRTSGPRVTRRISGPGAR